MTRITKSILCFEIFIVITLMIFTSFGPAAETQFVILELDNNIEVTTIQLLPELDTSKEFILTYNFTDLEVSEIEVDNQPYHMVSFKNGIYPSTPGLPMLPYKQEVIGIPTGAIVDYQIIRKEVEIIDDINLLSCPKQSQPLPGTQIGYSEPTYEFSFNPEIYNSNSFYPGSILDITERGFIRDQEIVRLKLYPAQYNPQSYQLQVYRHLEITIRYQGGQQYRSPEHAVFSEMLKKMLFNYEMLQELPVRQNHLPDIPQHIPINNQVWYKVTINECGIYNLDQADFQDAGIDTGKIDPRTLKLYNSGGGMLSEDIGTPIPTKVEIPIYVKGEGDGKFDSGDSLTFYGFSYATWVNNVWTKNYYEDKNVYWLTWGGANGKRMATKSVTPSGGSKPETYHQILHLEEDHETSNIGTLDYRDQVIWSFSEVGGAPWTNDVGLVKQAGDIGWADYNISLNTSRIAGSKGFMVMFRVTDKNSYYILFFGDNGNTKLRLCKASPSWKKRGLRAVDHVVVSQENYTVNISLLGNNIKCFVNGTKLIDYTDNSNPYLNGRIGLNVDYDSVFDFSNISVIGINETSAPFRWYENFTNYPLRSNGYPVWTNVQGSLGDFTVRERHGIRVYESTTENIRTTFELGSWNRSMTTELRGYVKGMSAWNEGDKKHHGVFYINGYKLLERNWTGHSVWNVQAVIPNWMLKEGINELEFDLPGNDGDNWDYQALDWLEVDLWRDINAYDDYIDFNYSAVLQGTGKHEFIVGNFSTSNITGFKIFDFTKTERLINPGISLVNSTFYFNFTDTITSGEDRYIIVNDGAELKPLQFEQFMSIGLNSSENYHDYLLITHEGLYNESDPNNPIARLANHRETISGLNVTVITTQQIYDVFSSGLFDPTAIRNFLKFAYDNWTHRPSFVLFAGDTSSAFRLAKYRGTYNVPTHLDDYQGQINGVLASDNWLCCVSGDDSYPDFVPGRLPFASLGEAAEMVEKIISYDNSPDTAGWRRNAVFHADNTDSPWEAIFKRTCTEQIEYYLDPNGYIATQEAYLDDNTNAECKAMIKQGVNDGCIILQYSGHGSPAGWASFGKGDIDALTNQDMYPFVMSMGCSTGTFDTPNSNSFCEEIVLAADKGGIASWGPSRTATSSIYYLFHSFDNDVFNNDNNVMGLGCYNAILNWADDYHLHIMTFFGDPAMDLGLPDQDFEFKTNYRFYQPEEEIKVSGVLDPPISSLVNITIRDPDMRLWQFNQTTIINGVFQDGFMISSGAVLGTYRIFAFAWNGSLHWDGLKYLDIEVQNPSCNLFIANENITYSPAMLVEGSEVNLTATVENLGTQPTGEYDVWLFLNDPLENNRIAETKGMSIARESIGNISIKWRPSEVYAGQNIYIVVDPEDKIDEFDEDDNKANITLFLLRRPIAYCGDNINAYRNYKINFSAKGSVAFFNKLQNYTWDFADGTRAYSIEPTHSYSELGEYNVTLTIKDENNLTDTANITVNILNKLPVVDFDASTYIGFVTTEFYFNSTGNDPDGSIVEHNWSFGDGSSAVGEKVEHYYTTKSTFTVNLTVVDNDGGNNTISRQINIRNLGPSAVIDVSEQMIASGDAVIFSGANSTDPDDAEEVLNYTWVINNDHLYSQNFTHIFELSGTYNISLTVTDPDEVVDTKFVEIIVQNKLPELTIIVTPDNGTLETEFVITAEALDQDGYITWFYIDIGSEKLVNRSINDKSDKYLFELKYNFETNTDKTITAYAIDNHGARSVVQTIVVDLENILPTVDLGLDMDNVFVNRRISFDPKINDADGTIVKFEWDLDGDGKFELEDSEKTLKHRYSEPGEYKVTLRVTDNDNGVSEDTINVTVIDNGELENINDNGKESPVFDSTMLSLILVVVILILILVVYFIFVRRKKQENDSEVEEKQDLEHEEPAMVTGEPESIDSEDSEDIEE